MKTLKGYKQFNEGHKPELDSILDEYIERFQGEYDYDIVTYGNNDTPAQISIYHVDDGRGEPGEEFKDQIAADNQEAADELINLLDSRGYATWETVKTPTYTGFAIVQLYDPRTPPSSRRPSRFHIQENLSSILNKYSDSNIERLWDTFTVKTRNRIKNSDNKNIDIHKSFNQHSIAGQQEIIRNFKHYGVDELIDINKTDLPKSVAEMEQALRDINFFVGGLTDEQIKYYYNKHIINKEV
jgi:hypothetical protein